MLADFLARYPRSPCTSDRSLQWLTQAKELTQCLGAPPPGPLDTLTFLARVAAVASRDHPRDSGRCVPAPPGLRPPRVSWCGRRASPAARRRLVSPGPARSPTGSLRARFKNRGGAGRGLGKLRPGGEGESKGPREGTEEAEGGDQKGSRKRAGSGRRGGVCVHSGEETKENPEGHWRSGKLRTRQADDRASGMTGGGYAPRGTTVPTPEQQQLVGPLPSGLWSLKYSDTPRTLVLPESPFQHCERSWVWGPESLLHRGSREPHDSSLWVTAG